MVFSRFFFKCGWGYHFIGLGSVRGLPMRLVAWDMHVSRVCPRGIACVAHVRVVLLCVLHSVHGWIRAWAMHVCVFALVVLRRVESYKKKCCLC